MGERVGDRMYGERDRVGREKESERERVGDRMYGRERVWERE